MSSKNYHEMVIPNYHDGKLMYACPYKECMLLHDFMWKAFSCWVHHCPDPMDIPYIAWYKKEKDDTSNLHLIPNPLTYARSQLRTAKSAQKRYEHTNKVIDRTIPDRMFIRSSQENYLSLVPYPLREDHVPK